jgi:outer membrane protein assembly factor BamB
VSAAVMLAAGLTACGEGGEDTANTVTPLTTEVAGTATPASEDTSAAAGGAGCPGATYGTGEIALVMLDARTGELCYRFDSERLDVDLVVVVDGMLVTEEYEDGDDKLLIARDLTDGVERWSVPANYQGPRGYLPGIPAGTGGGIITALGPDETLEGIALDDGTVRWTVDLGVDPDEPPVLRDSATTVAVVEGGGPESPRSLVGIDRETGAERWRWQQPDGAIDDVDSSYVTTSVDADGHAYLESLPYQPYWPPGAAVTIVDLESGEVEGRRQRGPGTTWRPAGLTWDMRAGLGDLTFGYTRNERLRAWDASGGVVWRVRSNDAPGAVTAGDGGVAWSSYAAGRPVTVADAATGQPRWTYEYPAVEKSLDHIMFSDGYLVYGGHTSSD